MSDAIVPQLPPLATVRAVQLMAVGSWDAMYGQFQVTSDILYQAVAALDCPAVRNPVLKFGHTDPRAEGNSGIIEVGDGEPALGWVDNMTVSDNGSLLIGDYKGMPGWLAAALPSAYPDRSIEGFHDFTCQLGHSHPFVMTAVALLGASRPAIGVLESLNLRTIGDLYGVMAVSENAGAAVAVHMKGSDGMPPTLVAAQATVSDVTTSFYDMPAVLINWWLWIEEVFIDPAVIIACDDSDGTLWEYSYSIDDSGVVTFGDPSQVLRTYVAASVSRGKPAAMFASARESRPAAVAAREARKAFAASEVAEPTPAPTGPEATEDTMANSEFLASVRTALGVDADADETTTLGALTEALSERAEGQQDQAPIAATAPGTIVVDAAAFAQLQANAAQGVAAFEAQQSAERTALVSAAVKDGRIAPAGREAWLTALSTGPDGARKATADALAALPKNTIPVAPIGHTQGGAEALGADTPSFKAWVS